VFQAIVVAHLKASCSNNDPGRCAQAGGVRCGPAADRVGRETQMAAFLLLGVVARAAQG
jgi:hypothetical protein